MKLVEVSFINAIAVVVKMAVLFGINKTLAVFVGPSGYALLGQFQNMVQIVTVFCSGAVNTGVTKYTAEYAEEPERQKRLWSTAGTITLVGSLVCMLLMMTFKKELAVWLLHDEELDSVFLLFAVGLVFFVLNALLLAILNGKSEIKTFVIASIMGSLISFVVTIGLVMTQGLWGALVALAVFQSGAFFSTLYLCKRSAWFKISYLFGVLDKKIVKNLSKYTLMAVTSAVCAPVASIVVRDHIIDILGVTSAGYWEAMSRLSGASMMLFSSILSVYFLPKYSRLTNGKKLKDEILKGYKIILPVLLLCCVSIYLLRYSVISLLFSRDFLPMESLFFWYQIGDFLKMGSWLLAFLMLGKAMMKTFIATELVFSVSYVMLTIIFTNSYGLVGASISYAINYLLYWVTIYFVLRKTVLSDEVK